MSSPENSTNGTTKSSAIFSTPKKSWRFNLGLQRRKTPVPSSPSSAPSEPFDSIASITLEDIKTAQKCGSGGFSVVIVFSHQTLGQIALKKLTTPMGQDESTARRRTIREGDIWRGLAHPNVLPFWGVLETLPDLYLVSPYIANGSLDSFIRQNPDVDRQRLLAEAAAAISYLHGCGIIHGNIKASNILVSNDIHALLGGFGLARSESTNTSIGLEGVGTIRYESPELLVRGSGKTFESDVWAFGMTIYEILASNIPFYEHSSYAVISLVVTMDERPPMIPSHSSSGKPYFHIWNVAKCCWHKDPALRPSMIDARDRLEREEGIDPALPALPDARGSVHPDTSALAPILQSDPPVDPANPINPITGITLEDIRAARKVGEGGFGAVLVFNHPTMGQVALKRLTTSRTQDESDVQRRTVREGDTWQGLTHPNVLPFLGVVQTSTELYLVSPYVKNGSLDHFLHQNPNADRQRLLAEGAAAVAYLHGCGIVHGDIKSSNILVSDDVRALLCDFGLARSESANTSIGLEGAGTIRYQSPELLVRGGMGKTFESDVWAFGMTIYEILASKIPFHEHHKYVVIDLIMNKDKRPPTIPSHSPSGKSYFRLWNVAKSCWQKDATLRPSMRYVHRRLNPEPVTLQGHTKMVSCVAFSNDSKTIASGSMDRTIRLWDMESERQIGEALGGHTGCVRCLAFSPDGTTIASGSDDETIRLWDVESGSQKRKPLEGHTSVVSCLAFSSDGTIIVSGSGDTTIRVWDVASGSQRGASLEGHTGAVWCLALSPDSRTIVSGSWDRTIRLWDVEAGNQKGGPLEGHTGEIWCLALSSDGRFIASGSWDKTIRLWDMESRGQKSDPWKGHDDYVGCLAFSPDGTALVSGSGDETIRLWNVAFGSESRTLSEGEGGAIWCLEFSPDGTTIACGCGDDTLRLCNG